MRAITLAAILLATLSPKASAQNFPTRPITFVVPYAAGGTTDVLARIVGKAMGSDLGQTIIVENVGGAGGTVGTQRVVRAQPDGYTLTFGNMGSLAQRAKQVGFVTRRRQRWSIIEERDRQSTISWAGTLTR
jgi:tripartite-type tricarboxylate transporter receptor subunit TctC